MEFIKKLPRELVFIIYAFIPIDIRLKLIITKYPITLLRSYNYCLGVNECIQLYTLYVRNTLLIRVPKTTYDDFKLKSSISKLLPKIRFKSNINNDQSISIGHMIEQKIVDIVSLKYIPRRYEHWVPHNLERNQREYLYNAIDKTYSMFSTLEGGYKKFQYILKKTLLFYLIALIRKAGPEYEKSRCLRDHIRIKKHMKKYMFKELRKKCIQYKKRSKLREKEQLKKQKELLKQQKKKKQNSKGGIPKNIVIIRKKKRNLVVDPS